MPKGKYYEYQIKRSALDQDYLSGNIDDFQYARESLDLDLKYEPYILAQTINRRNRLKNNMRLMMPNNNWINFPKDPYDGLSFLLTLLQKIHLHISLLTKKRGQGQWIMITHQDFSKPY